MHQKGPNSGSMPDEKSLVKGCVKGDRTSQKALYDLFARRMFAICLRYSRSREEAEDILQEGFIKVYGAIDKFRHDSALATWMTRIMVNTAINAHRRKLYLFPMVEVSPQIEDPRVNWSNLHFEQLMEIVQSLPEGCRIIFNLFAVEGYGHKEIAEMLNISEGTSKSQYARARALLQERLLKEPFAYEQYGKQSI